MGSHIRGCVTRLGAEERRSAQLDGGAFHAWVGKPVSRGGAIAEGVGHLICNARPPIKPRELADSFGNVS